MLPQSMPGAPVFLPGLLVCMPVWSSGHLVMCALVWYFGASFLSAEWVVGVPRQIGFHWSLG